MKEGRKEGTYELTSLGPWKNSPSNQSRAHWRVCSIWFYTTNTKGHKKRKCKNTKRSKKINDFRTSGVRISGVRINDVRMNDVRINEFRINDVRLNDVRMNDVRMNDVRINDVRTSDVRTNNVRINDASNNDVRINDVSNNDVRINDDRNDARVDLVSYTTSTKRQQRRKYKNTKHEHMKT